jgi:hypothetical protein
MSIVFYCLREHDADLYRIFPDPDRIQFLNTKNSSHDPYRIAPDSDWFRLF